MPQLSLTLLGPPQIWLDAVPIVGFESDRVRALLIYLALERDRPQRREALAELLWPERPPDVARTNLRRALTNLRQALNDRQLDSPFLLVNSKTVEINPAADCTVDAGTFSALLHTCAQHQHRRAEQCRACLRRLQQAADLYRGDFLQGFSLRDSRAFDDWSNILRERLHTQSLETFRQLAEYHERRGEYEQACSYLRRQVELEPWLEEAHRQLMLLLGRSGQRSAALAQYEACRRLLEEELGIEPTEETVALYERLLRGEPLEASGHVASHLVQLPQQLLPFVGRERELEALSEQLEDPTCRLLTLLGPGGIGKTRLALEAAAGQVGLFRHGVAFVSLVAAGSREDLVLAIAEALGVAFAGRADPAIQLMRYLRQKELLLVLDNVEQLVEEAALLVELLREAPLLKLLVTSRERLNIQPERIFDVEGLDLPQSNTPEALGLSSAAQLFVQSARRMQAGFALNSETAPQVAVICRLVEGMPLALELAAAWVRELSPAAIARDIAQSLDRLSVSLRDVPPRQRSMRAAFDYSWRLLSEAERQLLSRLAIFRGSFSSEALAAIAPEQAAQLQALVDKSLVRASADDRYELYEVLRQYAAEQLTKESTVQRRLPARHCEYYTALLQRLEPEVKGRNQKQALQELALEIDNIRAAWGWAVEHRLVAALGMALDPLYRFYDLRGWLRQGLDLFERAAECLGGTDTAVESLDTSQACVLSGLLGRQAVFCHRLGLYDRSVELLQTSLHMARHARAGDHIGFALNHLGYVAYRQGRYAEAHTFLAESASLYTALGDDYGRARAYIVLSDMARMRGDHAEAQRLLEWSFATSRQAGDARGMVSALNTLGFLATDHQSYAAAWDYYQESLSICREIGYQRGTALCLINLCGAAKHLGRYAEAEAFGREALAINEETGDRQGSATSLNLLADLAETSARYADARRLYQEALAIRREIGEGRDMAHTLRGLGAVTLALGDPVTARGYFYEALQRAAERRSALLIHEILADVATLRAAEGARSQALQIVACILQQPNGDSDALRVATELLARLEPGLSPQEFAARQAASPIPAFDELVATCLRELS